MALTAAILLAVKRTMVASIDAIPRFDRGHEEGFDCSMLSRSRHSISVAGPPNFLQFVASADRVYA